jgi:hypothetical protein
MANAYPIHMHAVNDQKRHRLFDAETRHPSDCFFRSGYGNLPDCPLNPQIACISPFAQKADKGFSKRSWITRVVAKSD